MVLVVERDSGGLMSTQDVRNEIRNQMTPPDRFDPSVQTDDRAFEMFDE